MASRLTPKEKAEYRSFVKERNLLNPKPGNPWRKLASEELPMQMVEDSPVVPAVGDLRAEDMGMLLPEDVVSIKPNPELYANLPQDAALPGAEPLPMGWQMPQDKSIFNQVSNAYKRSNLWNKIK